MPLFPSSIVLAISLVASSSWMVSPVSSCTCMSSEVPNYCQADFVALVQVVGKLSLKSFVLSLSIYLSLSLSFLSLALEKQINPSRDYIRYRVKILDLLVDRAKVSLARAQPHLYTAGSSAMCGVELARNGRYLVATNHVGGAPGSIRPARLQLNLCRSFIKRYDGRTRVEPAEWQTMKEACLVSTPRRHADGL